MHAYLTALPPPQLYQASNKESSHFSSWWMINLYPSSIFSMSVCMYWRVPLLRHPFNYHITYYITGIHWKVVLCRMPPLILYPITQKIMQVWVAVYILGMSQGVPSGVPPPQVISGILTLTWQCIQTAVPCSYATHSQVAREREWVLQTTGHLAKQWYHQLLSCGAW